MKIHYMYHTTAQRQVRVWKDGDPHDTFTLMSREKFEAFRFVAEEIGFVFEEVE